MKNDRLEIKYSEKKFICRIFLPTHKSLLLHVIMARMYENSSHLGERYHFHFGCQLVGNKVRIIRLLIWAEKLMREIYIYFYIVVYWSSFQPGRFLIPAQALHQPNEPLKRKISWGTLIINHLIGFAAIIIQQMAGFYIWILLLFPALFVQLEANSLNANCLPL